MSENTKIEWCDHSWSPWRGCTKVSPGCLHCYAETLSKRNPKVLGEWGRGRPRVLAKNWGDPVRWNKRASVPVAVNWNHTDDFGEPAKRFYRPTVFPSLCDWLDEEVDSVWLYEFIKLIIKTPNLTWLLLTKRPENFVSRLRAAQASCTVDPMDIVDRIDAWISGDRIPLNVWPGTSVENQEWADKRIPHLLRIPAAGRFLSVEPMLGPVDLFKVPRPDDAYFTWRGETGCIGPKTEPDDYVYWQKKLIHWVIYGGESGPGARPCNIEWIRDGVKQCKAAGVAPFVKQLGANACFDSGEGYLKAHPITHPKGGDMAEWPEDLRVREFPEGLR